MKFGKLKTFWKLIKRSAVQFATDNLFVQAAALSYYTIFALPPILLIILRTTSLVYQKKAIQSTLFGMISDVIGRDSARQLSETIDTLGLFEDTWWATAVGIGGLFITSTTVFITIQNSLNRIFRVRAKPKSTVLKLLRDRVLSFAFLLSMGFILLISLLIDSALTALGNYLSILIPGISIILITAGSILLPLLIITFLFGSIFRFLPDAKLKWREVRTGAILTTLLFSAGKYLISFYIGRSQTTNLYDAAGEVLIIMLWVFYAANIFLFGAVFTRQHAEHYGRGILPADYAVRIIQKEEEVRD